MSHCSNNGAGTEMTLFFVRGLSESRHVGPQAGQRVMQKNLLLDLVSDYLTDCKYGGPVRNLPSVCQSLGKEYTFRMLTGA
jgi:hypothetical protein